jgi:acyl-CoA synthetase (NDP forming)/GNAT superfamily N-acetyltransferase
MTVTDPLRTAAALEGWHVLLRDGSIAEIRPLASEDEQELHALNSRASEHSRLMRYFSVSDRPGRWYVEHLMDQARLGNALVALVGSRLVGVASYARLEADPATGDLGMLVDDEHQGSGLGSLLLEHLAHVARNAGITAFHAEVLSENGAMLRMLRSSGLSLTTATAGGVTELAIDTFEGEQAQDAARQREIVSERASLHRLLAPRTCAVVGSSREGSVGHRVVAALTSFGFTGQVHVVDRPGGLRELVDVDLVVVCVPAERVLDVARDAAAVGAGGLLVLSAGFAEAGEAGRLRQDELLRTCRDADMRVIGPNCLGVVNTDPAVRMNATFCETRTPVGRIAVLSQSGAVGIAALRHAERRRAGLSLFVSTGNKADVSGNDLLEYLAEDDGTSVVAMYLESFGNARKFAQVVRRLSRTKPVIVVKSGRTKAGARAGQSHTAAAATPDVATDALLRSAGAIRADDMTELFDLATVLDAAPLPRGRAVAVIGNSGGPGVLAVDALDAAGLHVAELSEETQQELRRLVPASASVQNPVDLLATVTPEELRDAVAVLLGDPSVDAVISVYTPVTDGSEERIAAALVEASDARPDVPLLTTFPGTSAPPAALARPGRPDLPFFEYPEQAAGVLAKVVTHAAWRSAAVSSELPDARAVRTPELERVLLADGQDTRWLDPEDVETVLRALRIPAAPAVVVSERDRAAEAAEVLGFPVVLKAYGPAIVHKSELGAVVTGLRDADQVRRAWDELSDRLGSAMSGGLLQRQLATGDGVELVVGGYVDDAVGALVMVGMGGTLTDVVADRVLRVPPRSRDEALAQVAELRCASVLRAFRGRAALAVDAVADVMVAVGQLLTDCPEVREVDLNPLLATPSGVWVLDARIAVAPPTGDLVAPFRALRPPLTRRSS